MTTQSNIAFVTTPTGINIFIDAEQYPIAKTHRHYAAILAALDASDANAIRALADAREGVKQAVAGFDDPAFAVSGTSVLLDGVPFPELVSEKVLRMQAEGLPMRPILAFLRKVRENPSATAQNELLLFCEANGFPIHEDGDILAYKKVRGDYFDTHSASVFNKPAALMTEEERAKLPSTGQDGATTTIEDGSTVVTMPRFRVDDRRNVTCSHGLHFAAHNYANGFGGSRLLILKLNPRDVVSIPNDYNNEKGRCARYVVLTEVAEPVRATGLPAREVYADAEIAPMASGETPASPVGPTTEDRVLRVLGEVLGQSVTLDHDLDDYDVPSHSTVFEECMEALNAEFGLDLAIEYDESPISIYDDLSEIAEIIDEELAERADEEDEEEGDEDGADEGADEGEEEQEDEPEQDAPVAPVTIDPAHVAELSTKIMSREISSAWGFLTQFENVTGLSLSDARVEAAARGAGFGAWL